MQYLWKKSRKRAHFINGLNKLSVCILGLDGPKNVENQNKDATKGSTDMNGYFFKRMKLKK